MRFLSLNRVRGLVRPVLASMIALLALAASPALVAEGIYRHALGRLGEPLPKPARQAPPRRVELMLWAAAGEEISAFRVAPPWFWRSAGPGSSAARVLAGEWVSERSLGQCTFCFWAAATFLSRHWTASELASAVGERLPFGRGTRGLRAGAQAYFAKSPDDLEPHELALLYALGRYGFGRVNIDGCGPYEGTIGSRNLILQVWAKEGLISTDEMNASLRQPLGFLRAPDLKCEESDAAPVTPGATEWSESPEALLREARDRAQVSAVGRLLSVTPRFRALASIGLSKQREARLEVLEVFKGAVGQELRVIDGSDEGVILEVGKRYLALGRRLGARTELKFRLREAKEDDLELAFLRTGTPPPAPVALIRERVECDSCNLGAFGDALLGLERKRTRCGFDDHCLYGREAADAARSLNPFWTSGRYRDHRSQYMLAVGLSRERRAFQLKQEPYEDALVSCRQRITRSWCERLAPGGDNAPHSRAIGGELEVHCINPDRGETICDESASRTATLEAPESLTAVVRCEWDLWHSPLEARCNLKKRRVELEPARAAETPLGPTLRCVPAFNDSDWTHRCRIDDGTVPSD